MNPPLFLMLMLAASVLSAGSNHSAMHDSAAPAGRDVHYSPLPKQRLSFETDHSSPLSQPRICRVVAGISAPTAAFYGGVEECRRLITHALSHVNNRFDAAPPFLRPVMFRLDSVFDYPGTPLSQMSAPLIDQDLRILFNGTGSGTGGGWIAHSRTIYHDWSFHSFGGTFSRTALDGLTHEAGHALGAIDLYALSLDADSNPVTGQAFRPPPSIMTYPYGCDIWDTHSRNIIDHLSGFDIRCAAEDSLMLRLFPPSIGVRVLHDQGTPASRVLVRIYPVFWYANRLASHPLVSLKTGADGEAVLTDNPFDPGIGHGPWACRYPNFLVTAESESLTVSGWMPLTEVQNAWFQSPDQPYRLTLTLR